MEATEPKTFNDFKKALKDLFDKAEDKLRDSQFEKFCECADDILRDYEDDDCEDNDDSEDDE